MLMVGKIHDVKYSYEGLIIRGTLVLQQLLYQATHAQ